MISALNYSPQMQCFGAQVGAIHSGARKPRGCDRLGQECHSLVDCTAVHPLHPVRRASQAESVSPPDGCRIDRLGGVCEAPPMQCFVWRHCQLLGSEARCGTPSSCHSVESAVLCALIRTSEAWHRPPSPTAALIYNVGHAVLTQVETGLTATLLLLSMCGMVQPLRCRIKTYSHSIRALVACQIFSMQSSSIGVGEGYERMLWWMCILALTLSSVLAFLLLFNEVGGPTGSNHRNSVMVLP